MSETFSEAVALSPTAISAELIGLLAETPWAIALTSADGRILALSKPLLELLDVPAATLIERPLVWLFLDEERARLQTLLDRGALGRTRESLTFHLRPPGRLPVAVEIEAIPIPDDPAARMAVNVYPLSTLRHRERLMLEFNLLAANLLASQSADELYSRASQALRPLGIGLLITLLEPDGAALRVDYASIGPPIVDLLRRAANVDFTQLRIPATAPLFAEALEQWEPFFATGLMPLIESVLPPAAAAICRHLLRLVGFPGCIMAPFLSGQQARGVLMVWSHMLSREDLRFVGAFAHQIGAILAQITLRRQLETQVQRLNSLATTARAVTTLGSLDEALQVICVQAQELLGADFARIAAPIAGVDIMQYIMSTGYEANNLLDIEIPIGSSVSGAVLRSGRGRLVADLQAEADVFGPVKARSSARSVLYQPLQHQGRTLGVLIVGSPRVGLFSQADLDYLGRYAEYAAVAMANAQLHAALQQSELEQQRQRRQLAALLELSKAVNHSLNLATVLDEGLRVLEELGLATVSTVLLLNADASAFELRAARGIPADVLPKIEHVSLDTISGDVLRAGRLRILSESECQRMLDQYGITDHFRQHTSVYIPLIVGDKHLGVLGVIRPNDHRYAEQELSLLRALANQLAQAVAKAQVYLALQATAADNARLYREADEARGYLNTLVHNTPDLLITIRPDQTMHILNPERINAAIVSDSALFQDRKFLEILPAHLHPELLARWQQILAGQPQTFELELTGAHGRLLNLLLSGALVADYGEVIVIVKDVTEQRRNEAQIRQNEKLAALGRMVAGAAHELNNPLAAILGLAQLQMADDLVPALRTDLERIERAALRARSIVQQLLTFARAQRPEPQPVVIAPLIHETLERLAAMIARDGVQVDVEIAPNLPAAGGDPDQLAQVLFNIVHNALQALAANPLGAPRALRIRARQDGGMLQLAIIDTGPGIAPEHLPRLFEPFFTTRAVGQGTGLGLAITHAIIQQHQGRIWATSQPGQGTMFTIDLPLSAAPVPAQGAPALPALPADSARILLVEDEEMVRSVLARTLARHRYHVDAVGSGEDALEHALAQDYALVISDLQMPGLDGAALYDRLHQARPSLCWLIMTGDTMGERSRAFLERTGLPALPKPFTQEQLLARVAECVGAVKR